MGTDFFNANRKPLSIHEDVLLFVPKLGKTIYNQQRRTGFKPVTKIKENSSRTAATNWRLGKNKREFNFKQNFFGDDTRCPVDVVTYPVARGSPHSTAKPVPLLEWLIKTYTNEGMTVLDNCMGSGSTGVACMNTGRRFFGIEINKEFCDYAAESIETAYLKNQNRLI